MKYECVMKLRKQLDQLGKMKGITQDEKGMFASDVSERNGQRSQLVNFSQMVCLSA